VKTEESEKVLVQDRISSTSGVKENSFEITIKQEHGNCQNLGLRNLIQEALLKDSQQQLAEGRHATPLGADGTISYLSKL